VDLAGLDELDDAGVEVDHHTTRIAAAEDAELALIVLVDRKIGRQREAFARRALGVAHAIEEERADVALLDVQADTVDRVFVEDHRVRMDRDPLLFTVLERVILAAQRT